MNCKKSGSDNESCALAPAAHTVKSNVAIQRKLAIGDANDPLEHQADAMADKVMRMPEPNFIQRKCAHCEEEEKAQRKPLASFIQKKESADRNVVSDAVSNQIQSTKGSGSTLPGTTKNFMENRFGADFSDVRVHTNYTASQLSNNLSAQAFTVGNDIYFNNGKFSPGSTDGKQLLAHELTHVLQQAGQNQVINRQAALAEPVVEPAFEVDWAQEPANENVPDPLNSQGRIYVPNPHDYSTDAVFRRGAMIIQAERSAAYWSDMVQMDVMMEGVQGSPPDFITTQDIYVNSIGGGNKFRPGKVQHFLSKIKFDFEQANDFDTLAKVYSTYAVWFRGQEAEKEACKVEPDFDLIVDAAFLKAIPYNYVIPQTGREIYKIRYTITDQAVARFKLLKQRVKERQIAAELAAAEETTLKGKRKKQGACTSKIVPHKGGNKKHNTFADHVANVKGYGTIKNEIAYTTPEGIEYAFDTYNPATQKEVWEVKTYHEWLSDAQISKAEHIKGGFEPRFLDLEEQRLRGLYVASRCNLNFRYAFDKCETVLGMRKHWLIPPIEYIPYPGEPKDSCVE